MNELKMIIKLILLNFILLCSNSSVLVGGAAPAVPAPAEPASQKVPADQKKKAEADKKEADQKKKKAEADKKAADEKAKKEKAAAEPTPPKEGALPTDQKPLPPVSDIDTVDIEEGGNWLLKRKALEDTVDIIEQINAVFSKILEASTNFKIKRNKIDSEFDAFLSTIGFDLGDADQLLATLLDDLEQERKDLGDLTADERAVIASINEKKNEIKQLQTDLTALTSLDDEIDKVVSTVDNQIKTANNYQGQAWKNFQAIKKVLSDEKAEDLYYRTEGLFKSMQDIYTYLTSTLSNYFNGQMQTMRDQMSKVKGTLQSLQQKGVNLKQQVDTFEKEDEEKERKIQAQEEEQAIKKAVEQAKRKKPTLMQSIMQMISYPLKPIKALWDYLYGSVTEWFTKPTKKAEPADQQPPTETEKTEPVPAKS